MFDSAISILKLVKFSPLTLYGQILSQISRAIENLTDKLKHFCMIICLFMMNVYLILFYLFIFIELFVFNQ